MSDIKDNTEGRVAVLVDCDNTTPEILDYALRVVAQFGRVVLRRGYGNHTTLANNGKKRWSGWPSRLACNTSTPQARTRPTSPWRWMPLKPCLTTRADTFCLVTSDSDFAYLCRKLRERGATVHIVGEAKTPDALRNASDQFFEWLRPTSTRAPCARRHRRAAEPESRRSSADAKSLMAAVTLLAADTRRARVILGPLGQYLKRTDPAFSPKAFGHSGLLEMIETYTDLVTVKDGGGYWVSPKPRTQTGTNGA